MSISDNRIKLVEIYESHQESFYNGYEEDADVPPTELSGDQNALQTITRQPSNKSKANFALTVIIIIKTIIGTGLVGLPFTVSQCGFLFAIIVYLVATAVTQLGSILLLKAKNLSGHSNYSTILYHIYRNKWCKGFGSILIFFNNLGLCILQIIALKQTFRKIIVDLFPGNHVLNLFYTSTIFIALVALLLLIPFILVSKIERLRYMSGVGVIGIFLFFATFVAHYFVTYASFTPLVTTKSMVWFPESWLDAIASIPNLLLAFSFHMNFFPIFKGMRRANDSRIAQASLVGIIISSIIYLAFGILGYHLAYTMTDQQVYPNFILSLSFHQINTVMYSLLNAGFLLCVFFSFPVMFFGCRNNFIALINLASEHQPAHNKSKKQQPFPDEIGLIQQNVNEDEKKEKEKKARCLFIAYTFLIFTVTAIIGILVDDIEIVFNALGAICSTSIGILLPCFFYFQLIGKKKKRKTHLFYLTIFIFALMIPLAILAVIAQYI